MEQYKRYTINTMQKDIQNRIPTQYQIAALTDKTKKKYTHTHTPPHQQSQCKYADSQEHQLYLAFTCYHLKT